MRSQGEFLQFINILKIEEGTVIDRMIKNLLGPPKGLDFHYHVMLNKGMKPTFLIFQVTQKCNLRCHMCNIWKREVKNELTGKEILKLFNNPFFSDLRWVNVTGGEPFIRRDLAEVISILKDCCPSLEIIGIPTNGLLTERISRETEEMLRILKNDNILLNINVSIDAFSERHDYIRGVHGSYKQAISTLETLTRINSKNFLTGVEVLISGNNVNEVPQIYAFLKETTGHINFTPVIASDYFDSTTDVCLSKKETEIMLDFFEVIAEEKPEYAYYYKKVNDVFRKGFRTYPCLAGYKTMYISSTGDVYPCHYLSEKFSMGCIREESINEIWMSKKAKEIRRMLKRWDYCKTCTNNCDILNVMKEEFFNFSLFMLRNPKILKSLVQSIQMNRCLQKYI